MLPKKYCNILNRFQSCYFTVKHKGKDITFIIKLRRRLGISYTLDNVLGNIQNFDNLIKLEPSKQIT